MPRVNKRAQMDFAPLSGVILIAVMLVSMLAFILVMPKDLREDTIPTLKERPAISTLLDVGSSTIYYEGPSGDLEENTWNLPDIRLDGSPIAEQSLISTQFLVSKGIFSSKPASFNFTITAMEDLDSVFLQTYISDVNGDGSVVVELNNQLVFASSASKALDVELPMEWIQEGNNVVSIRTTSPGVFFWKKNAYTFAKTYITSNRYVVGSGRVVKVISIPEDEANHIEEANLELFIPETGTKELTISLNGFVLYSDQPNSEMIFHIPVNFISSGTNMFEFDVERGGLYDLQFIKLTTETSPYGTAPSRLSYTFKVNEADWKRIQTNTVICDLRIKKYSGANAVKVNINGHEDLISFSGDIARKDVCDSLMIGNNRIAVTATQALAIENMELKLRR